MKTEQFDDEFRKKLLGLDPSDEEIDRIYNYVSSHSNTTSYFSWTKILIYGLVASLLVGSLTFNYVQNLTNKKLLSSLDSLKNGVAFIDQKSTQKITLRVDTVYIDRYIERTTAGAVAKSFAQNNASGVELNNDRSDNTVVENGNFETTGNHKNPTDKAVYTNNGDFPKAGRTIENYSSNTVGNSNDVTRAKESKNWLPSELSRIGNIRLFFTSLKLPVLKTPENVSSASQDKPKYYSESMKSVLKKMDYYVGGSLGAGNRQVEGSLLGELQITPKWSFQTGARWKEITGNSYDTAEQFDQQTGQDFRALYAPFVAQNVDLLNIEQNYQLVQIPLTIAYNYEIRPNWALRFGVGTDLSVSALKDIHFNYKRDSQSFDKGEYNAKLSIKPINDITLNLGLERRSNKFLFRLSPYLSPQLRKTEFSKDLLWGARVQALYKFNRKVRK